jgi:hypothetical protein
MILDEFGVGNTVRIGEDKVGAFCSSQGLVEDCVFAKPSVFVPEVTDWAGQGWGEANDQIASGGGGPIIGNENLHRSSCLVAKTCKALLQRANVIVGTNDEGNLI